MRAFLVGFTAISLFNSCSPARDSKQDSKKSSEIVAIDLNHTVKVEGELSLALMIREGYSYAFSQLYRFTVDEQTRVRLEFKNRSVACERAADVVGPFFTLRTDNRDLLSTLPKESATPVATLVSSYDVDLNAGEYVLDVSFLSAHACESVNAEFSLSDVTPHSEEGTKGEQSSNPTPAPSIEVPVEHACTDAPDLSGIMLGEGRTHVGGQGGAADASWFTKNRAFSLQTANSIAPSAQPTIANEYRGERPFVSSPAILSDGSVVVGNGNSELFWLKDGTVRKELWLGCGIAQSTPAVLADDTIVVGCNKYSVLWLKAGAIVHRFVDEGMFWESSPAVLADGTVVIGGSNGSVYWLKDGKKIAQYNTDGAIRSSPSIMADDTVVIGSDDHNIYWLKDGALRCKVPTGDKVSGSASILADGTVVIGSEDKNIYWINRDGKIVSSFATKGEVMSTPALLADETVVVASNDRFIYWLRDGDMLSSFGTLRYYLRGSPLPLADSSIFYEGNDYNVYWLKDGTQNYSFNFANGTQQSGSTPALLKDGTLVVVTANSVVWMR